MLYVVSGYMRTGTTMMMEALDKSGLEAEHEKTNNTLGDIYELPSKEYQKLNFPREYDGKLIKALREGIIKMDVMDGIKAIFMRRDKEEIVRSYMGTFGFKLDLGDEFQDKMEKYIRQIKNRKDIETFDVFWYRNVIDSPRSAFEQLEESGWPINVEKAVEVIDPEQAEHNKEKLTKLS